ncbi:MAG: methyl-accepting chemotaxis protein [Leclercia sp.]
MKNISVRMALSGAICIFVLIIVAISSVGFFAFNRSNSTTDFIHKADRRVILINDVYKDSARTRSGFALVYAGLIKSGQSEGWVFKNIQTTHQRMLANLEIFKGIPVVNSRNEEINSELIASATALGTTLEKAEQLLKAGDVQGYYDINITQIDKAGGRFSAALEKYQKSVNTLVSELMVERENEYRQLIWVMGLGLALALLMSAAVLYVLRNVILKPINHAIEHLDTVAKGDLTLNLTQSGNNEIGKLFRSIHSMQENLRGLVGKVRSGVDEIHVGSREIAAGNLDLSARTEEQASSLEQTAASMEELASIVKQNADNAHQANVLALKASEMAESGGKAVSEVVTTMNEIATSSNKIAEIVAMIDSISFQTNILALNAAVEAARAGEQGKGFAVVASEVRTLAQRSATAAKEIKDLIQNSSDRVNIGTAQVKRAGAAMLEIVTSVKHVTDTVAEISLASREQATGIDQVNLAVSQMDGVTQQNASLVEQAAAAAHSLESQASALAEAVSVFRTHHGSMATTPA